MNATLTATQTDTRPDTQPVPPIRIVRAKHIVRTNLVQPVYGTCGHIAKDARYTCGSPRCSGWGW